QITIDEHFDAATAAAVKRWEAAHGLAEDGKVQLGRVVFLPGAQRVASVTASLGEALPGTPASGSSSAGGSSSSSPGAGAGSSSGGTASAVMSTTSDHQVVTVQLESSKQTEAVAGEHLEVTLPSGAVAQGTISRVGRVAQTSSQAGSTDGQSSNGQSSNAGNSTGGAPAPPPAALPLPIQPPAARHP